MNKPPVMISTKDTIYMSDLLNVIYFLIKRFDHYDSVIQDKKIKQLTETVSKGLKNQYESLLEVLNND